MVKLFLLRLKKKDWVQLWHERKIKKYISFDLKSGKMIFPLLVLKVSKPSSLKWPRWYSWPIMYWSIHLTLTEGLLQWSYNNSLYHCREFQLCLLTAPNATDNIVCMRSWESSPSPCWAAVITPRFPTSCPPAKLQNLTCFTPHVTNWLSESGLNSATKILSVWPWELASLMPKMREKRCIIL